jgi:Beta-ketoacyl synthase, N-terminal domain
MMLPALGPAHAPHLRSPDLEYMIGNSRILEKTVKRNYQLISGSTNRSMVGPNLKNLLKNILEDIFQHTAKPERVFEAGISLLNKEHETSLFVLGNTSYLPSFKRTLQKKRVKVVIKSNSSTQESLESHVQSESVAIVGMSGRFPGSDSVEELWASIMERKEFHKKVMFRSIDGNAVLWSVDIF